ncbi:unnamed protein product [Pleuronectes platessa]|uniref:Zinc finger piccolo-type domain-containing protein n=1 Tax=Pleuronectes platessa TaxID=8262 RepID=A0A9N7TXF9_PLEPL|nr:unnamed protein product [Pleuronectes platessa]
MGNEASLEGGDGPTAGLPEGLAPDGKGGFVRVSDGSPVDLAELSEEQRRQLAAALPSESDAQQRPQQVGASRGPTGLSKSRTVDAFNQSPPGKRAPGRSPSSLSLFESRFRQEPKEPDTKSSGMFGSSFLSGANPLSAVSSMTSSMSSSISSMGDSVNMSKFGLFGDEEEGDAAPESKQGGKPPGKGPQQGPGPKGPQQGGPQKQGKARHRQARGPNQARVLLAKDPLGRPLGKVRGHQDKDNQGNRDPNLVKDPQGNRAQNLVKDPLGRLPGKFRGHQDKDPQDNRAQNPVKDPQGNRAQNPVKVPQGNRALNRVKDPQGNRAPNQVKDPQGNRAPNQVKDHRVQVPNSLALPNKQVALHNKDQGILDPSSRGHLAPGLILGNHPRVEGHLVSRGLERLEVDSVHCGKEWLCLNCQMQRAMGGMDPPGMSKPKQGSAPPSPQRQASGKPGKLLIKQQSTTDQGLTPPTTPRQKSPGPTSPGPLSPASSAGSPKIDPKTGRPLQQRTTPQQSPSKAKQESSFFGGFGGISLGGLTDSAKSPAASSQAAESVTGKLFGGFGGLMESSKPQPQALPKQEESVAGKLFGGFGGSKESKSPAAASQMFSFGSSLLSSATNLVAGEDQKAAESPPNSPADSGAGSPPDSDPGSPPDSPFSAPGSPPDSDSAPDTPPARSKKPPRTISVEQEEKAPAVQPAPAPASTTKESCPLCTVELNVGSSGTPNYSFCTECKKTVCNLCGFNPTPHLGENRWFSMEYFTRAEAKKRFRLSM